MSQYFEVYGGAIATKYIGLDISDLILHLVRGHLIENGK